MVVLFAITHALSGRKDSYSFLPIFQVKKREVWKGQVTCSRSRSQAGRQPSRGSSSSLLTPRPGFLPANLCDKTSHTLLRERPGLWVMGPGSRPRGLQGAFSGELARTLGQAGGARSGVTLFPAQTLGPRDGGGGCCYLGSWILKGQARAPPKMHSWQEVRTPAHHPSSHCSLRVQPRHGPSWGDLACTCQKGPVGCGGGQASTLQSGRVSFPEKDRVYPMPV